MVDDIVSPKKLETGFRTNSAGIPYTLLLRIQAIGFPTVGLLLYTFCLTLRTLNYWSYGEFRATVDDVDPA